MDMEIDELANLSIFVEAKNGKESTREYILLVKRKRKLAKLKKRMKSKSKRKQYYKDNGRIL